MCISGMDQPPTSTVKNDENGENGTKWQFAECHDRYTRCVTYHALALSDCHPIRRKKGARVQKP